MNNKTIRRIVAIQGSVNNGVTDPKKANLDNNNLAIIKLHNNPETDIIIFNEYFFYNVAILVGVPMPVSGLGIVDKDTIVYEDCINASQLGYCFYSTFLHTSFPLKSSLMPRITNINDFWKILLFDHIVFNSDRNLGNLLIQYSKDKTLLYAIDHTHVLPGQSLWSEQKLKAAMLQPDYYSQEILNSNMSQYKYFLNYLEESEIKNLDNLKVIFSKKVTEKSLREILIDIPTELLPSSQKLDTMINYILYRVSKIDYICETIKKYLSARKGVRYV